MQNCALQMQKTNAVALLHTCVYARMCAQGGCQDAAGSSEGAWAPFVALYRGGDFEGAEDAAWSQRAREAA